MESSNFNQIEFEINAKAAEKPLFTSFNIDNFE
jgi:hypothetical protein